MRAVEPLEIRGPVPKVSQAGSRGLIPLSPQGRWLRAFGVAMATALYLLLALLLSAGLSWQQEAAESLAERIAELESQVVQVVQLPPGPEVNPEIGRVNQGDPGDPGALPEDPTPEPVEAPETQETAEIAPESEVVPEPPAPQEPDLAPAEAPPETVASIAPPEAPVPTPEAADPLPLPAPQAEVSEAVAPDLSETLSPLSLPNFDGAQTAEAPPAALEPLALDTAETQLVLTAAAPPELEAEEGQATPLALPPSKPTRDVTLPEPVTRTPPRVARAPSSERQGQGRARSATDREAQGGGGFGGGGETNYLGTIARQLNREKEYPAASQRAGEEGIVAVQFTLDEEGWVVARRIVRSSGHKRLDAEVMDLLLRSSPLPKPPTDGEWLTLTVRIAFIAS
ncbi:MAG: hypothetical protein Kilf2KO_05620 [Rhodospirillales bacterium]